MEFADERKLVIFAQHFFSLVLFKVYLSSNVIFHIILKWYLSTDGARAALNLGGTMLGYYPVRVLPSKTAILPVNPTFLPRVLVINLAVLVMLISVLCFYCMFGRFSEQSIFALPLWSDSHFIDFFLLFFCFYMILIKCSQRMRGKCVLGQSIVRILIRRYCPHLSHGFMPGCIVMVAILHLVEWFLVNDFILSAGVSS